jgi:hypothetical protein
MSDLIKVSFNLPRDEFSALRELAARRNTTMTQTVRAALATEMFLQKQVDDGAIILTSKGRQAQEIVMGHMQVGSGDDRQAGA